jgi:SBF-like CPA transporter family (DUF4137)
MAAVQGPGDVPAVGVGAQMETAAVEGPPRSDESKRKRTRCSKARVQAFLLRNFLPIGLATSLLVGLTWPWLGQQVATPQAGEYGDLVPTLLVIVIFVISGLTLKTDDIKQAATKKGRAGTIYGLLAILGITPLLGFGVIRLPLAEPEFAYGLAVFCAVPTTIASGVSMVTQAGGNGALVSKSMGFGRSHKAIRTGVLSFQVAARDAQHTITPVCVAQQCAQVDICDVDIANVIYLAGLNCGIVILISCVFWCLHPRPPPPPLRHRRRCC